MSDQGKLKNRRVGWFAALGAAGMLALAFASVPLYRLYCQASGYAGTTSRAEHPSDIVSEKTVVIRFDANTGQDMPWQFKPKQQAMTVKLGENALAFYEAYNPTSKRITGSATFNVVPEIAGRFFKKVQCFCFSEQTLEPGERAELAVSFYVDPEILKEPGAEHVGQITLSYTFFRNDNPAALASTVPALPEATKAPDSTKANAKPAT